VVRRSPPFIGETFSRRSASSPGETGATVCESNLSKPADAPWSQPAPTDVGVEANPYGGVISPGANPCVTNAQGSYGWSIPDGCWYVTVEADGYLPRTSPVVGTTTAVSDLHIDLLADDLATFSDVPSSHRFFFEIMWLGGTGVTTGYPDGTFKPGIAVQRQAMAAYLYRHAANPEGDDPT
jgi:hypothetical protein